MKELHIQNCSDSSVSACNMRFLDNIVAASTPQTWVEGGGGALSCDAWKFLCSASMRKIIVMRICFFHFF